MQRVRLAFVVMASFSLAGATALRGQEAAPQEYPGLETGKMWTFDAPPLDYWAQRYNFRPSQEWLDHARLSAGSLGGCTASFVSADGLILTNHHCSRGCIDGSTRPGEDLLTNGFYAKTRGEERACPGMFFDDLLGITDVTDSVAAAVPAGTAPERGATLRNQAISGLEQRCAGGAADVRCRVVVMYRGGQYKLYRFRRYTDLRLVFAPEGQIAFFGGDPDNFVYPRHDLDMSIVRAYLNGQPAHIEHYFRWSRNGSQEGDLVFVVGVPGGTNRLNTIAYLEFLRDVQLPATLARYRRMLEVYRAVGAASPERGAALRNAVFGIANDQKRSIVYLETLQDPQVMAHKREWERTFRDRVNANAEWRRLYGDAWDKVTVVRRELARLDVRNRYYAFGAYGARLLNYAGAIVRLASEGAKPDSARLPQFRDASRPQLERALYNPAPVDTLLESRLLAAYLTAMSEELPANDPVRRAALGDRSPEDAARALVMGAQILTPDQRRMLVQGGPTALAASTDPFVALARVIDPLQRDIDRQWTELLNREVPNDERIARAMLAVFGGSVAPDANGSLRITDGVVSSYPYNGSTAQPYTTFFGLYDRSLGFGGRSPFDLPQRWQQRRDSLNLATPLNSISTNDIIGGNSGSPVISKDGEIVGLIFDGNMESLPWRFLFTEARGRSVWVDSRGIVEALRKVYDAGPLADELTGRH
jgi:hypothetical protein